MPKNFKVYYFYISLSYKDIINIIIIITVNYNY